MKEDNTNTNLIYEDNGKGEGDIIVGRRPSQNTIGGFRPVSSGQIIRPDNYDRTRNNHHARPSNFSVLISGIKKNIDVPSLARLFKEGKIAEDGEHNAFIGSPDVSAPNGFHKINLPFMDPSQSASFITLRSLPGGCRLHFCPSRRVPAAAGAFGGHGWATRVGQFRSRSAV